ncbi:hypothetical protein [Kitasatospora sp. MMS16-BH015]|uniref:hypothetical protein n=1 Tax=Kitasatospora sp. MMS16-BH015 TaxID=2018025 RepID=UPI00131A53C5|nr:hypothetical protein [Kitasatospora sp. MMS16-BH015]
MFDARVLRYLPPYELAPADADIDWEQEREYASGLLEEAEMELADQDTAAAPRETESDQLIGVLLDELHRRTEKTDQAGKQGRNSAYLAAWKAKRDGGSR